jgi:hypothetical protein
LCGSLGSVLWVSSNNGDVLLIRRYTKKEEQFFRKMMFPEEERHTFTSQRWNGGFRWFRSENVICLEHYRKAGHEPARTTPASGNSKAK